MQRLLMNIHIYSERTDVVARTIRYVDNDNAHIMYTYSHIMYTYSHNQLLYSVDTIKWITKYGSPSLQVSIVNSLSAYKRCMCCL